MIHGPEKELMQTKPFSSPEEAVLLSVMVTAEQLKARAAELFKSKDLTHPQYNVLRILRGAGKDGRSCKEIGERMINRDSDITRMLDRLEKQGLITRERQTDDRRVVMAYITKKGLEVLSELDGPVNDSNRELLGHMSQKDLETLGRLLKKARNPKS